MTPHLWLTAATIGAFVAVQATTLLLVRRRIQWLRSIFNDARTGGASKPPSTFAKVAWFDAYMQSLSNPITTSDLVSATAHQADDDLSSIGSYRLLQKLSVMAPLVGVVLTSIGFASIRETPDNLNSLALPLASGVFAGALLAIINQFVLFVADGYLQAGSQDGRRLIEHFWNLRAASYKDPQSSLSQLLERFDTTVAALARLVGQFPRDVSPLTGRLNAIATAAESTVELLNHLGPHLQLAVSNATDASSRFAKAIDVSFAPATKTLSEGVVALESSTRAGEKAMTRLVDLADEIALVHSAQRDSVQLMKLTIEETANQLSSTVRDHLAYASEVSDSMATSIGQIGKGLADIGPGLASTGHVVTAVTTAASSFVKVVNEQVAPSVESLASMKSVCQGLSKIVEETLAALEVLSRSEADHLKTQDVMSHLIRDRALPTMEVLQRATGTFEDASHRIAECSAELAVAIDELLKQSRRTPKVQVTSHRDHAALSPRESGDNR